MTVNGVSVAGLDRKEAEAVLRRELGPRVEKPVELRAGEVTVSLDPGEPHMTMTAFIAITAQGENPVGSVDYNNLFAVASLLFVLTFLINMASVAVVRRFRQEY